MQISEAPKPSPRAASRANLNPLNGVAKIDIFRQGKDLEAAAKHFGMKQGLQCAL